MSYRKLDLTIISAEDLKRVSRFGKMEPYAVVWIDGSNNRLSTRVDKSGGLNPSWNQSFPFVVNDYVIQQPAGACLNLEIYSKGSILGDKFVGVVRIPLSEITRSSTGYKDILSYQVRRRSGKAKGVVKLSVRLGDKVEAAATSSSSRTEPVMAYPPSGYDNQKPPHGYYPPPQQQAPMYGGYQAYPPQPQYQPPYAGQNYYPPQQQYYPPARRPGRMGGMGGMGTGLLAGALGGFLVGEMVGDAFDHGGGGYDNFDNGGGFDGGGFDGGDMGF